MHTKVFGRYEGPEEVMSVTNCYTEINVIDNYAPTARAVVQVVDAGGKPVPDAIVEFKLYNYAEFYTVARKQTDAEGKASLTAGKGDMLVWAICWCGHRKAERQALPNSPSARTASCK